MNSIDIYNAMMTQQKSRDQNSNIYHPRKCKFAPHFISLLCAFEFHIFKTNWQNLTWAKSVRQEIAFDSRWFCKEKTADSQLIFSSM